MKDYLICFAQAHANFRKAELESLADYHDINLDLLHHDENHPFLIVQLENDTQAQALISRSVLCKSIYELMGHGSTLEELHADIKQNSLEKFTPYKQDSFKFDFVGFLGSRENSTKFNIIESFEYLKLDGRIRMKNPDQIFTLLEEYEFHDSVKITVPNKIWFGRQILLSARSNRILDKYDLKKRAYIGTTSFDDELALVSCNIAQVGDGKIVYDPFTGTGSFLVAAAEFGGITLGSDIDVRIIRGKSDKQTIKNNFKQYNTIDKYIDVLAMDFTNNSIRDDFMFDTIVCDPPYGVREGLKICGAKNEEKAAGRENVIIEGERAHLRKDYIPPKKPYELSNLLDDLLEFSAQRLPIDGRVAFWMPTANDDFEINQIPQHERLQLLYNLEQEFNKWSRRLLVYVKKDESYKGVTTNGLKQNNITNFRDRYFKGFSPYSR